MVSIRNHYSYSGDVAQVKEKQNYRGFYVNYSIHVSDYLPLDEESMICWSNRLTKLGTVFLTHFYIKNNKSHIGLSIILLIRKIIQCNEYSLLEKKKKKLFRI